MFYGLYLQVYDADIAQMETFLGKAQIDVSRLPANEKKQIRLVLRDVPTGSIVVECEYIPLVGEQTPHEAGARAGGGADDREDVLYDLPAEHLGNDVLESDDQQDDLLDDDADGSGVWAWSDPQHPAGKTAGQSSGHGSGHGAGAGERKSQHGAQRSERTHRGGTVGRHGGAVGVLQVAGIQLRNLQLRAASLFSSAGACYVQCSMGHVQKRTRAIEVRPELSILLFYFVKTIL